MRTLRHPSMKEIVETNRKQGEDALRFTSDIIFIPTMYPPQGSLNVTWGIQYVSTAQATWQTAFQFQVLSIMKGCLNLEVYIEAVTGGYAYFQFEDGSTTIWNDTIAGPASKTVNASIPWWESTGTLRFQIKKSGGATAARARVNKIFLSARPFYSY